MQKKSCCQRQLTLAAVLLTAASVLAADVSPRRRAADILFLRSGQQLSGVVLPGRSQKTIRLLTRTEWLKQNAPAFYKLAAESCQQQTSHKPALQEKLKLHIERLQQQPETEPELIGFLTERLEGLSSTVKPAAPPKLTVLEIPENSVRQKLLKSQQVRRIAGFAILNDLPDSETADAALLTAELRKIPQSERVLEIPQDREVGGPDTDTETLLQYILLQADISQGRAVQITQVGSLYFCESDADAPDMEQLADRLLKGVLQGQAKDLLNTISDLTAGKTPHAAARLPDNLPAAAVRIAEDHHAGVAQLWNMNLNINRGQAVVTTALYRQNDATGRWQKSAEATGVGQPHDIPPQDVQTLSNDPRVQQITRLFKTLGSSTDDLSMALSFGAAVRSARQKASTALDELLQQPFQQRLQRRSLIEVRVPPGLAEKSPE